MPDEYLNPKKYTTKDSMDERTDADGSISKSKDKRRILKGKFKSSRTERQSDGGIITQQTSLNNSIPPTSPRVPMTPMTPKDRTLNDL